jgi:hypothetical protein
MSLQSQLNSLVLKVAERFAQAESRTGALDRLRTETKTDLVAAINELAGRSPGGDPTGGGSGGEAFVFVQSAPSRVWVVNHNLGWRPAVSVVDTGGAEVQGDVRHTHLNQLVISFVIPLAGVARLT